MTRLLNVVMKTMMSQVPKTITILITATLKNKGNSIEKKTSFFDLIASLFYMSVLQVSLIAIEIR